MAQYLRWRSGRGPIIRLVESKAKLTPIDHKGDAVKAEMCGAVFASHPNKYFELHSQIRVDHSKVRGKCNWSRVHEGKRRFPRGHFFSSARRFNSPKHRNEQTHSQRSRVCPIGLWQPCTALLRQPVYCSHFTL